MNQPVQIVDGYFAVILDDESQDILLKRFPPKHARVFAHHITVVYKPTIDQYEKWQEYLGDNIILTVYGYAEDEAGQAVVVEADILQEKIYHITISTNNVPPSYSSTLLGKGYQKLENTFSLKGTFEFVKHG